MNDLRYLKQDVYFNIYTRWLFGFLIISKELRSTATEAAGIHKGDTAIYKTSI
jgi:hypothetical protein